MSIFSGIRLVCIVLATMAFQELRAQHYLFIEADGQQPFYLKQGNKMVSSSAAGFLILPKITASETELSIGFPKNIYPEVSFYVKGTDRDRGFQLKKMEGQGWSLFDRTSLEMIKGETPQVAPIELQITPKEGGSFAKLLSAATDDKSLLERSPRKDSTEKPAPTKPVIHSGLASTDIKPVFKDSIVKKAGAVPSVISISNQTEDEAVRRLVYVEKINQGIPDTISVEIEKKRLVSASEPLVQRDTAAAPAAPTVIAQNPSTADSNAQVVKPTADHSDAAKSNDLGPKASPIIVCDRPIADYKDIRALQKKLLGISSVEEQRNHAVKAFGLKCFNTKQALEIGWLFVDETNRLQLFKALKPLVSDKASFGNLEVSFLKEENITAFKALVAGDN